MSKQKRIGISMNPSSITLHSTGNDKSTAQNERDWLTNPSNKRYASYHYVVGDDIIIECIPPNEVAYHTGTELGNFNSIGIEMVETGARDKVIDNTIKLVRNLQREYHIGYDNVVRHYDWSGKNCPRIFNYDYWKGWKLFKDKLIITGEPSGWAVDSWTKATDLGVVDGKRPKDPMTREEVITVINRLGVL